MSALIRSLLPGIFLFGYCIGTGSVTAMAKAGADCGMLLLWTVLIFCLITYDMIGFSGKLGNKKELLGRHPFGFTTNLLLALTFAFAVVMSILSYRGMFAALRSWS
jgi:Mn2+/Fe2+ NRAMP family transporter